MNKVIMILSLTGSMLTPLWALETSEAPEHKENQTKFAAVTVNLDQNRLTEQLNAMIEKADAAEEYQMLPLDKSNPESVLNLIEYADTLLELDQMRIQPIIDFLSKLGISRASQIKVNALVSGDYGYPKDLDRARELLEKYIIQGHEWAYDKKKVGLALGFGKLYKKDPNALRVLIDTLADAGFTHVMQDKFDGLQGCNVFYEKNESAIPMFVKKMSELNYVWGIKKQIEGLGSGKFGYPLAKDDAKSLLEMNVDQGAEWASALQIQALRYGMYGYSKDSNELIQNLLEKYIAQRAEWAIKEKINAVNNGLYGYERDPLAAKKLIKGYVDQGEEWAYQTYYSGILEGKYGYWGRGLYAVVSKKLEKYIVRGSKWAIGVKIKELLLESSGGTKLERERNVLQFLRIKTIVASSSSEILS